MRSNQATHMMLTHSICSDSKLEMQQSPMYFTRKQKDDRHGIIYVVLRAMETPLLQPSPRGAAGHIPPRDFPLPCI